MTRMPLQPNLPVITINSQTLNLNTNTWLSTSHAVRLALEEYGCFVVSTKEVPWDSRETMFELSKDLFNLPLETKIKNTSRILGFGYGNHSSLPLFECFGVENGATLEAIQSFTNLLFPSGNDVFCESTFEYMNFLSEIHKCIMRMVFDSYGVEDKQYECSSFYLARIMKYGRTPMEDEDAIALPPHSDKSFLGVLDDNNIKGLEVKMRNGEWIHHEPSPSTFVVIAGEPLKAWSNGRIYAPLHQVVMRTSAKEVVRYSTGLFSFTRDMVEVPQKLVDDGHYLRFRPFNNMEFLNYVNTYEGKASKCTIESYCGITSDTNDDDRGI